MLSVSSNVTPWLRTKNYASNLRSAILVSRKGYFCLGNRFLPSVPVPVFDGKMVPARVISEHELLQNRTTALRYHQLPIDVSVTLDGQTYTSLLWWFIVASLHRSCPCYLKRSSAPEMSIRFQMAKPSIYLISWVYFDLTIPIIVPVFVEFFNDKKLLVFRQTFTKLSLISVSIEVSITI
jgi:hypothetical protein